MLKEKAAELDHFEAKAELERLLLTVKLLPTSASRFEGERPR
jgi:hypothetical protein